MTDRLSLTIPGAAVPLERHRIRKGQTYLPPRSRAFRELVQTVWMASSHPCLGDSPLSLSARFYGANGNADLDNLVKAVLDALTGLAFTDDRQVVCFSGCHRLPADDRGARTEIELWIAHTADLGAA
jgi:Holliday junction resolvase RusA-like endonuclease